MYVYKAGGKGPRKLLWLPRQLRSRASAPAPGCLLPARGCPAGASGLRGSLLLACRSAPAAQRDMRWGGGLRAARAANVNAAPCCKRLRPEDKGGTLSDRAQERLRKWMAPPTQLNCLVPHQRMRVRIIDPMPLSLPLPCALGPGKTFQKRSVSSPAPAQPGRQRQIDRQAGRQGQWAAGVGSRQHRFAACMRSRGGTHLLLPSVPPHSTPTHLPTPSHPSPPSATHPPAPPRRTHPSLSSARRGTPPGTAPSSCAPSAWPASACPGSATR